MEHKWIYQHKKNPQIQTKFNKNTTINMIKTITKPIKHNKN